MRDRKAQGWRKKQLERQKRRLSLKQRQKGREEMRTQRETETLVKGQIEKDKEERDLKTHREIAQPEEQGDAAGGLVGRGHPGRKGREGAGGG